MENNTINRLYSIIPQQVTYLIPDKRMTMTMTMIMINGDGK
jgi:hypothetical protein